MLTELGELRNHDLCLDAPTSEGAVKSFKCHKMGGNQKWEYDPEVSVIGIFIFRTLIYEILVPLVALDF